MKSRKSFEEAINELETIVQKLEKGELPLEESLDVFQKGIELSKFCNERLDSIEKKITILLDNKTGEIKEEDYNLEA